MTPTKEEYITKLMTFAGRGVLIDVDGDLKLLNGFPAPEVMEFRESLTLTKQFSTRIQTLQYNLIPIYKIKSITEALEQVMGTLSELHQVPEKTNRPTLISERLQSFKNWFDRFFTLSTELISTNDILTNSNNITSEINSLLGNIRRFEENAKAKMEVIDTFAQQAGIATHANIFSTLSRKQSTSAGWWLFATVVMILLTISSAIYLLQVQVKGELNDVNVLQFTITKIIVVSCLFLLISMCIKNYRAQKHNQMINLHRSNALTTFDALIKTQTDEVTKNAILLSVTNTIFGNQATGFSGKENSSIEMYTRLLEKLKIG